MIDAVAFSRKVFDSSLELIEVLPSAPNRVNISPAANDALVFHMIVEQGAPLNIGEQQPSCAMYGMEWFVDPTLIGEDFYFGEPRAATETPK